MAGLAAWAWAMTVVQGALLSVAVNADLGTGTVIYVAVNLAICFMVATIIQARS